MKKKYIGEYKTHYGQRLEKFLCELHFNNEHRFIAFDELIKLFVRGIPV